MVTVLKRVRINTTESRLEMITPSSKQGVISNSLRRETVPQPSLSLHTAAILDDKFQDGFKSKDFVHNWLHTFLYFVHRKLCDRVSLICQENCNPDRVPRAAPRHFAISTPFITGPSQEELELSRILTELRSHAIG